MSEYRGLRRCASVLSKLLLDLEKVQGILDDGHAQREVFGSDIPESLPRPLWSAISRDRERQSVAIVSDAIKHQSAVVKTYARFLFDALVQQFPEFVEPPKSGKPTAEQFAAMAEQVAKIRPMGSSEPTKPVTTESIIAEFKATDGEVKCYELRGDLYLYNEKLLRLRSDKSGVHIWTGGKYVGQAVTNFSEHRGAKPVALTEALKRVEGWKVAVDLITWCIERNQVIAQGLDLSDHLKYGKPVEEIVADMKREPPEPKVKCYRRKAGKGDIRDAVIIAAQDASRWVVAYSDEDSVATCNYAYRELATDREVMSVGEALSYLEQWPETFRVVSDFIDEYRV